MGQNVVAAGFNVTATQTSFSQRRPSHSTVVVIVSHCSRRTCWGNGVVVRPSDMASARLTRCSLSSRLWSFAVQFHEAGQVDSAHRRPMVSTPTATCTLVPTLLTSQLSLTVHILPATHNISAWLLRPLQTKLLKFVLHNVRTLLFSDV